MTKFTPASDKVHDIEFQRRSKQRNALNEVTELWVPILSYTVKAAVYPLQGRELFAAQQVQAELSTRIICDYFSSLEELKPQDRIWFIRKSQAYDIRYIINVDMADRELQFMCTQRV